MIAAEFKTHRNAMTAVTILCDPGVSEEQGDVLRAKLVAAGVPALRLSIRRPASRAKAGS
jgi:hypothetical protein